MPSVNDIVKTTIITEYAGSQMSNALYWQIDSVGTDPPLLEGAVDILNAYADVIKAACTDTWAATCIVYENLTQNEGKTVGFNTTPGLSAIFGHGPDQVLRMNQYAGQADFLKVHRGAFNQSGCTIDLSTRGRWNDLSVFDGLKDFLGKTQAMGSNWVIQPFLNWTLVPAAPPVPAVKKSNADH